ncbi:sensor histidine kinase [Desulfofustis glycolicus]|uniref:histidine kinase n=1 Tax=Desulfofustis glycolicus DSM 9705 TaxID=1121409 RepID=A0A1M5VQW0_9BACT|nr:ATP-binding protein [Desulfofustis glycolicus]SHH77617.1 PAS/PAC sensor signal transduction histidine kinase [Desulfofustis glycolicus DSM 9705]
MAGQTRLPEDFPLTPFEVQTSPPVMTEEQRRLKKRMVRRIILFCLCLIPFFTWLQGALFRQDLQLPVSSTIIIFALININVILILIVLFLILRYLAELIFERKMNIMGSRLRTKLVVSFLSLSLIPTILLFFVALQFISSSVDYWFSSSIEESLQESLTLARNQIQESQTQAQITGNAVARRLADNGSVAGATDAGPALSSLLSLTPAAIPTALTLLQDSPSAEQSVSSRELEGVVLPKIPVDTVQQVKSSQTGTVITQETDRGDLVRHVRPIDLPQGGRGILVTTLLIDRDKLDRLTTISSGIEGYRQLKYLKGPFKFWLLLILLIVTLLIVFAAIWFGLRIARSITEPVDRLVAATNRVSEGDFDFVMENVPRDEIGQLMTSFNSMTANIHSGNKKLAETHQALEKSSQEALQRRRYMEIILQNVSAGVVSLDELGHITTINRFAEKLLRIDSSRFIGMTYRQSLPRDYALIIDRFIEELYATDKLSIEQHLKVTINRVALSLLVNFTRLEDDDGAPIGFVLVFDNLTKLEKMQRMAAWREVARRIAHEIKNPLTPIQLSAQRLRKRYPELLTDEASVFDRCTETIISQVEALRQLVGEFSQFARMPKINKAPANLTLLTRDIMVLYQEAHKSIEFSFAGDPHLPVFDFDAEQIKRCLINLLDNAVAVLPHGGKIDIELEVNDEAQTALITVSDNGPGISKENKTKLFEPYFSTKKTGTGLGLAIVSTIVTDHGGYIRVQDNQPHGSTFIIELPLSGSELGAEHSHHDFA